VPRHERFEELCAAASIGQASGGELAELQKHFSECADCEEVYSDFMKVNADQYASGPQQHELEPEEAIGVIDSSLLRQRFLKKAEAKGIVFSHSNVGSIPEPRTGLGKSSTWHSGWMLPAAASVLIVLGAISGYRFGASRTTGSSVAVAAHPNPSVAPVAEVKGDHSRESIIARLEGQNKKLATEIQSLKAALAISTSALSEVQTTRALSEKERLSLAANLKQREAAIAELQGRLDQARVEVAGVRAELDKQSANQATLVEAQIRLRDVSDQLAEKSAALDRERELLSAGRDVRDLMAARNLHIVDVFDTDPKGKTKPSFGRIFFTEGKSLVFYAYDLSDQRVQDAGYHYRIWGKREGPSQRPRNLGIFYSDDKSQRRWVFKYDDPKVLSEIDSVFVTVESSSGGTSQPKGDKFMYAYLKGQPNHP
jgi:hypothetical protein